MSVTLISGAEIMIKVDQNFKKQAARTYDLICSGAEISLPGTACSNKTKGKVCTKVYQDVR